MKSQNIEQVRFKLVRPLSHSNFDSDAIKVYKRLRRFKHQTYFVGGCVRDLLIGTEPKDFDIATAAHPRQVRRIFKNSRVIGKRFLIVNVMFREKIVEVTTFRKTPWKNGIPQDKNSMLLNRDNVFGSDEEDALRRDFTINALFYDLNERTVIDYVDGLSDLEMGKIRTIGDPKVRFYEDPVRMIRALKLKSRLGFEIVKETEQAIIECASQLENTASSRLLLEILKILNSGASFGCFESLANTSIFSIIAPDIHQMWYRTKIPMHKLLKNSLSAIDTINQKQQTSFSDATLLSSICYPLIYFQKKLIRSGKLPKNSFCKEKLKRLGNNLSFSKKLMEKISNIIQMQYYLIRNKPGKKHKQLLKNHDFQDALDFLYILGQNDPERKSVYNTWSRPELVRH